MCMLPKETLVDTTHFIPLYYSKHRGFNLKLFRRAVRKAVSLLSVSNSEGKQGLRAREGRVIRYHRLQELFRIYLEH